MNVIDLGLIEYGAALEIQNRHVEDLLAGTGGEVLLLLEHEPVYTIGRTRDRSSLRERLPYPAIETNRGGQATYHGPGQLVGYPIVDLRGKFPNKRGPHLGPVDFVRMLEEVLIRTCADFGVMAKRIPKCTGVWTFGGGDIGQSRGEAEGKYGDSDSASHNDERDGVREKNDERGGVREKKLAAIGVHVSQGVTSHGFALNVTTDLRDFDWIVPCGITDRGVTSLELEADPATEPTLERAALSAARNFGRVFGRQVLACESLEQLLQPASGVQVSS